MHRFTGCYILALFAVCSAAVVPGCGSRPMTAGSPQRANANERTLEDRSGPADTTVRIGEPVRVEFSLPPQWRVMNEPELERDPLFHEEYYEMRAEHPDTGVVLVIAGSIFAGVKLAETRFEPLFPDRVVSRGERGDGLQFYTLELTSGSRRGYSMSLRKGRVVVGIGTILDSPDARTVEVVERALDEIKENIQIHTP